jgi:hypothetical protein
MHLNLIWTLPPQSLAEADWIHWLLQEFEIVDHVSPGWDLFEDNSIYMLSGAYSRIPSWFQDGIRRVRGKGIFHLADESFTGGYEVYSNFDFVLRNYYSTIFANPGIKTLPLGFTNNMMSLSQTRPAAERNFYGPLPASNGPRDWTCLKISRIWTATNAICSIIRVHRRGWTEQNSEPCCQSQCSPHGKHCT